MKRFFLLGFGLLMVFDTLAQICSKFTAVNALPLELNSEWLTRVFLHPWIYGAIIGYVGTFFTWITLLKKLSIGASFAASHVEVVSVMIISIWIFDEPITGTKFIGAIFILSGIVCLAIAEERLIKLQVEPLQD